MNSGFIKRNIKLARIVFYYLIGRLKGYRQEVSYLCFHGLQTFPYPFTEKYYHFVCDCQYDETNGCYYIIHSGKKLYFPKHMSKEQVIETYRALCAEQDQASPHRYWTDEFRPSGGLFVDAGGAEGLITLDVIDLVDKAVIIEADPKWIDALEMTFEPYQDKVTIINAFCSDRNDENNITLDKIIGEYGYNLITVKMDIEGGEKKALLGADKMISNSGNISFAVCTYHRMDDLNVIGNLLSNRGFDIEHSSGVMLYLDDPNGLKYPFFRKGIIRATKRQE